MGGKLDIEGLINECQIPRPKIFIESGTYQPVVVKGALRIPTVFHMAPHFETLYTIEIVEEIYRNSVDFVEDERNPFKEDSKKINFTLGDSQEKLREICKLILDVPALFHLDGHYSASWNGVATGKSASGDVPLYGELEAIRDHFRPAAIVVCDDLRLFGKKYEHGDWSQITRERIREILGDRVEAVFENTESKYSPWGTDAYVLVLGPATQ